MIPWSMIDFISPHCEDSRSSWPTAMDFLQLDALLESRSHGFFEEQMLAGLERCPRHAVVVSRGSDNVDDVDFSSFDEGFVIVENIGVGEVVFRGLSGSLRRDGDGDQFRVFRLLYGSGVKLAPGSIAYKSKADG
jgi:hypothetical protein